MMEEDEEKEQEENKLCTGGKLYLCIFQSVVRKEKKENIGINVALIVRKERSRKSKIMINSKRRNKRRNEESIFTFDELRWEIFIEMWLWNSGLWQGPLGGCSLTHASPGLSQ